MNRSGSGSGGGEGEGFRAELEEFGGRRHNAWRRLSCCLVEV